MRQKIALLWCWFVRLTTNWLPDSPITMRFRGWLLGLGMRRRGKDFQVAGNVRISGLENVSVGDHVYLAPGVVLLASEGITLGDEVMVAHHSVVTDGDHSLKDGSYRFGPRCNRPIIIGHGSWVAANCTVTAGVRIGRGALVGANSVVTEDVPDHAVAGGVPAKVIRTIELDETGR